MHKKLQRIVGAILLATNLLQIAAAASLPVTRPQEEINQHNLKNLTLLPSINPSAANSEMQNLALSTNQFGITGPFNAGINYSNLTGAYFSGQFLKQMGQNWGVNLLGEYGDKQYRYNGTVGFLLGTQSLFKISAEQLGQKLPFSFTTGLVDQQVKQNALGARFQQYFDFPILNNLSMGAYISKAPNLRLNPIDFISNGQNCQGFAAGLHCINERNIAGGSSSGGDLGLDSRLTPTTYLEGKLYYDSLHYNTIFSRDSKYNTSGYGSGVSAQQLLSANLKLSAAAEIRKIYNTYNLGLSWMPVASRALGTELSLFAQRVVSHNQLPTDDTVGLKVTFFADRENYQSPIYALNKRPTVNNIASWISQPAVKMNQVLAVCEELTHLASTVIRSINPNFGPLGGGNSVTITGTNFLSGAMVKFGDKIATITSMTPTSLTVIAPPANVSGGAIITVTTPDGKTTSLDNGYLYTNGIAPIVNEINLSMGSSFGGNLVTITGANFEAGNTTVTIGGITIPVNVTSPVSLTFTTPPHPAGTVMLTVTTPAGTSNNLPNGFTYEAQPTATSLAPSAGSIAGGTLVTITGTNFATGDTIVTIGGNTIPANSVMVNSPTSLTFSTPAHATGNVSVSVKTSGGSSDPIPGGFTYDNTAATTTALSPIYGSALGGTSVTINGSNFVAGNTTVTIGENVIPASSVTVNSATSLTFTTPAQAAGNVSVSVTTPIGSSNLVPGGFTYENVPTTISLTPTTGSSTGGTLITVMGTGFVTGDTSVIIGGNLIPASSVTVNSASSLSFNSPAHSAGNVSVNVVNSAGTSNSVPGGFLYEDVPTVVSLNPAVGLNTGGDLVVLTGTNFVVGDTSVIIGGNLLPIGSVTVNSATSLTFITPAHMVGNVTVYVATSGGTSNTVLGGFTYEATPTLSSLTPSAGPIVGNTLVTITGDNFVMGNTAVNIGGILIPAASVTVNSATSLTFSTPAHVAGNVSVTVTTPVGTSGSVPSGYIYEDIPTVVSLSPSAGSSAGGATVTLTGTNFIGGDTSVNIGGMLVPASLVTVNSATSLTFSTPAHAAGNVSVSVSTSGGTSNTVPGGFTYEAIPTTVSLTPTAGPIAGGTSVTLTGSGFVAGDTTVSIGGTVIPVGAVTVNSASSLTITTPAHAAGNVSVSVSTSGGTSNTVPGGFTYEAIPTTVSLTPTAGPIAGGTSITLTGSGFVAGDTTVSIGGTVIPVGAVTVNSASSLTITTPAHAAGNVSVSVSTSGGTSNTVPGGFTYEAIPTTVSLTPTAGPIAGGTSVTLTGSGFVAGDTTVSIGGTVIPVGAVTVNSASSLTITTPAHAAGNVSVSVSTSGGTSNTVPGGFTYNDTAASVSSLSPIYGSTTGGTSVTITGTNFVPGSTSVTIGGTFIPAGSVTVNSTTSLTFNTPAHIAGNVSLKVTTPTGDSGFVSGGFTYEDVPVTVSLTPTAGPVGGGTLVTLIGTGFIAGDTSVTVDGISIPAGSVTVSSPSSLTFNTPPHVAGNVSVNVATSAGGTSNNVPGGFTYNDTAATVTSLTPIAGPTIGGTTVTVTGTNFVVGGTTVTIGGTIIPASSVTVTSTNSLTFNTPVNVAGNVAVSVTTALGSSGFVPGGFTYEAIPTTVSLTPTVGPIAGGTSVTLTGSGFVAGDTTVSIGGTVIPVGAVTVNSSSSLTITTPAHAAGNVSVSVSTSGGTSNTVPGGFTYEAIPTTVSLTPTAGPIAGGTSVTLTGSGFVAGDTTVSIGGTVIPVGAVTVNSSSSLTITTPAHAAGNVSVSVSTSGGTSNTVPGGFTYEAIPTTVSLTPTAGPIAGGTSVTLTGSGFVAGDTTVSIGGTVIPVGAVTVNSSSSLTITTPAHAAGNVSVSVSTSGGTSNTVPGGFTYEAIPTTVSLTPTAGPIAGGTSVTLTGSGFVAGDTTVSIGGTVIPVGAVTVNSASSLTITTPAHAAGNVSVSVSTSGGTSNTVPGGFTYEAIPTTVSLTPTAGPIAGGTSITLTGSGFVAGDTTVSIGGTVIPVGAVTVNSASSLTITTPAHAAGNVSVSVSTSGGTSNTVPGGFTYQAVPTTASLTPTSGTTAGSTSVTITGTNFVVGGTTVTIGGNLVPASSVMVNSGTSLTFSTPAHAAGNVSVSVATSGGSSNTIAGGYTYLTPSLLSCSAPIPSLLGIQLLTCVGANLTLFQTTYLQASGSAACSTFPTETVVPTLNILGQVIVTATNVPSLLSQGLIGCNISLCSNNSCSVLGGVAGPVNVKFGL